MIAVMSEPTEEQKNAKKLNAPIERRAAVNFWRMLGEPESDEEMVASWTKLMREAMGFMEINDLEEFKKFLHWALEENAFSAKYLREANDAAVTLVKNIESLKKRYGAWLKAQEILNRKKAQGLNKKDLPAYRQESGNRTILKGDV